MVEAWAWAVGTIVLLVLVQRAIQSRLNRGRPATPASRIIDAAEIFGVLLVAAAQVAGSVHGGDRLLDAAWVAIHGVVACVMLTASGRIGLRVLLRARLAGEVERGNVAAAVAAAGSVIAAGIISSRCLYGHGFDNLGLSLVSFVIATVVLHLLTALFRLLTSYDDAEEILDHNLAAAFSYAGVTVAIGLIVGHAVQGEFTGVLAAARDFGVTILLGLALYPVRQVVVQTILLGARPTWRGGRIDRAISEERDLAMGVLEAATYLGTALMIGAVA